MTFFSADIIIITEKNKCSLEGIMEFRFVLSTVFEIAVAAFIIYGLFFEERFAEAERKAVAFIKRQFERAFLPSPKEDY